MVARVTAITLVSFLASASASVASDRLQVPGGTNGLRTVMELPSSVPDDMLLVEAVRAWYGTRDALISPPPPLQRLFDYMRSSTEPLADGPPLPLGVAAWARLLKCEPPCRLAATLVTNRNAMLLYHGLIAMDDDTQRWMGAHPHLLTNLLMEGAAAFSFAGPFVHVRGDAVALPGGDGQRAAWASVLGNHVTLAESFIRELMRRDGGRIAWLFSVLAQLDAPHLRFALAGDETLSMLARHAVASAPEWTVSERPFWRTPFDFSLVLALSELDEAGVPRGSRAFWREVFRSDDLSNWRPAPAVPLTAESLLDVIFEQPYFARERWEIFCLGQRLPGVERDSPDAALMLRGARRHPALAQMLDRIGVSSPPLVLSLHRASAKLFEQDQNGARGELGAWQGALAVIERAALGGGLDAAGVNAALSGLAALPLKEPGSELTAWLMDTFIPPLATRPGAPPDAERLVLQVMTGRSTPAGPRREPTFAWEDLTYSFGAAASLVTRMEQARAAQRAASLEDARVAWRIAGGTGENEAEDLTTRLRDDDVPADAQDLARRIDRARAERDAPALKREARRAAESIVVAALPALAYVPHLAVTEVPALGADVAFRHQFVSSDDGPAARRQRPWKVASGEAAGGSGWRLQGSLLMLDLALADWYLRRNGEPASAQPMFDEGDMAALAQVAAMARSAGASGLALADAATAVEKGRASASESSSIMALDDRLEQAGIDPWRRRAIRTVASNPAQAAAVLTYNEAWRLGGAPGLLSPHPAIDGGAHFGAVPRSTHLMEGRRSAGVIGASAVDAQLRVALFLQAEQLPTTLFGDVAAGVIADLIQNTVAARADDFVTFAAAAQNLDDGRLEEHLLALVADGTLARPSDKSH